MRKKLAYILVSLLYVCTSVLTCQVGYAAFAGGEDGDETQPRYSYTSFITAYVAENSDGDADCTVTVHGKSSATKISGYMYLEQYKNGQWVQYDYWYDSVSDSTMYMSETRAVTSGYKYRVRFSGTVYSGSNSESVSATSATVQF